MSESKGPLDGGEDPSQRLKVEVSDDKARNFIRAKLAGRLDVFTYRDLAAKLESHYENRPKVRMVIDLSAVSFVASSGWSVFIALRSRFRSVEGRLALAGMNDDLKRIYASMKLPELIPAFTTSAEAEAALAVS